ncbi:MAG: hypothetical protein V6Z89_01500 [Desulfobacter sp.]
MVKRIFILVLLAAYLFPVSGPLWGHDYQHAMHAVYENHQFGNSHEHVPHDHSMPDGSASHHPIDVGLAAYIRDHLHGGMQISSQNGIPLTKNLFQDQIFYHGHDTIDDSEILKLSMQEPPAAFHRNDLYLKTQRLRIGV